MVKRSVKHFFLTHVFLFSFSFSSASAGPTPKSCRINRMGQTLKRKSKVTKPVSGVGGKPRFYADSPPPTRKKKWVNGGYQNEVDRRLGIPFSFLLGSFFLMGGWVWQKPFSLCPQPDQHRRPTKGQVHKHGWIGTSTKCSPGGQETGEGRLEVARQRGFPHSTQKNWKWMGGSNGVQNANNWGTSDQVEKK